MRTRRVVIGVVVLVIGVALLAAGAFGALSSLTISRSFTEPHPGEYVSAEIVLNTTSALVISSPAANGGVIHAQDLGLVNSTNMGTYEIPINGSGAGSNTYTRLTGDYYYIAFASSPPSTTIVATPLNSGIIRYGALVLLGFVCILAGIVVAVIGAIQKPPTHAAPQP